VRLGKWLLGGGVLGGILLAASDVFAAPPRRLGTTLNEGKLRIALERLTDFIRAARIDAVAHRLDLPAGAALGVRPGTKFVAEDAAAVPRQVDGLDVVISGWPR
jgi:hypothetical protein